MTFKEFALIVQRMRLAQAKYFKTRSNTALLEAKKLEEQVDTVIKHELPPPKELKQQEMFGDASHHPYVKREQDKPPVEEPVTENVEYEEVKPEEEPK